MPTRRAHPFAAVLAACSIGWALTSAPSRAQAAADAKPAALTEQQAYAAALDAYVYAYPLVLMDVTRQQMTNYAEIPEAPPGVGPANRFVHIKEFPDPKFKIVVRPNVDTLYSSAWFDLAIEPIVLSVPATGRYFMLPMLDMWTDVFAVPGTRTTGNDVPRNFLIVGPNFKGPIPEGMEIIKAPTRYVWMIGRTQTNGKSDYENVWSIQSNYRITPMSAWGKPNYAPPAGTVDSTVDMKTPPPVQVANMDPATFYARFAAAMKDNPPAFYDYPIVQRMQRLGLAPGKDFVLKDQPAPVQAALTKAAKDGQAKIVAAAKKASGAGGKGWTVPARGGFYGNDYLTRAAVAYYGLGMNLPEDAIYPSLSVDSEGKPLNGSNKYVLRFDKGNLPQVNGFWSVTVYDADGYLFPNSIERNALGDRDKLVTGADGSVEIYLQSDSPGANKEANWLPVPKGPFNVLMRLYAPGPTILDGSWQPPPVKRAKSRG